MTFTDLPGRGKRSALSFDGGAEELSRYFMELEALCDQHVVTTDLHKKQGALKYLATVALERTWRASDTFMDAAKTYEDFKKEIHKYYPGSSEDIYTIHHLDALISGRARLGVWNASELGDFHLQFRTISKYLIDKSRMLQAEQMRAFLRTLQPKFENQVRQRLQITKLKHNPQDPYALKDLYEAAGYCLLGSAPAGSMDMIRSDTLLAPLPLVDIKTELQSEVQSAIKTAMTEVTEMFKNVFAAQAQLSGSGQTSSSQMHTPNVARLPPDQSNTGKCNFCGEPGHFMRDCEVVNEYVWLGKCKRNHENQVVLPSGVTVPRSVAGIWLCDRINEYHLLNPNQQGAAQMLCKVASATGFAAMIQEEEEPSSNNKTVHFKPTVGQPSMYAYKQSTIKGKAKEATPPCIVEIHSKDGSKAEPTRFTREFPPHIPQQPDSDTDGSAVEHPFAKPSQMRDPLDGEDSDLLPPHKSKRAYTTTSQIYNAKVAHKVFEQILSTRITLLQQELLSLAPELHIKIADATVRKHISRMDTQAVLENIPEVAPSRSSEAHMPASFSKAIQELPTNATIIKDPYEALLHQRLGGDGSNKPVKVAMESNALRAILPTIVDQEQVEAILDPGCQIVTMSEEVCIALSIVYDPNVRLNMVLANSGIDQSLSLATNVPFKIGEITVYLQVHVLFQPAYDILLGRPFDVLTESVVVNYSNENQTITILDPNTGRKATIPMVKCGSYRFSDKCKQHAAKAVDF
jgi:hypothetical protein